MLKVKRRIGKHSAIHSFIHSVSQSVSLPATPHFVSIDTETLRCSSMNTDTIEFSRVGAVVFAKSAASIALLSFC